MPRSAVRIIDDQRRFSKRENEPNFMANTIKYVNKTIELSHKKSL